MYKSIQICRALAAILVVFFHLAGNLAKDKYFGDTAATLEHVFAFAGTAGVAFFFVLSGFIILLTHWNDVDRPGRLRPYLHKRLARIYPTYMLIFVVVYLGAMLVPSLREGMPTDLGVLVKSLLLVPQDAKVVGGTGAPVIVVAWSLQYELVFYALVALAIINRWLCAAVTALVIADFAWRLTGGAQSFPASFFATNHLLLFALGIGAAAIVRSGWRIPRPMFVVCGATCLFIATAAAATAWRDTPMHLLSLGYGIAGAIAIVALVQAERDRPARFDHRTLCLLGDASYAIYLIHFPLIAVLCKLAIGIGMHGTAGMYAAFVLITLACLLVSVTFHLWIERPLLRWLAPRKTPDPAQPMPPDSSLARAG